MTAPVSVVIMRQPGPFFAVEVEAFGSEAQAYAYAYKVKSRYPEREVRVLTGEGEEVVA